MADTPYKTEEILVRYRTLNAVPYTAGTYKKGQLVARLTSTGQFTVYNPSGSNGADTVAGVCPVDLVIDANVPTGPVARGEFSRRGVAAVMAGLDPPITLSDALIGQCWAAGVILN